MDVGQDLAQYLVLALARLNQQVGRFDVGLNRAKGLIDLVRNRRRQLAGNSQARRVRNFLAMHLYGSLGNASAAKLDDQSADKQGLCGDDRQPRGNLPKILSP